MQLSDIEQKAIEARSYNPWNAPPLVEGGDIEQENLARRRISRFVTDSDSPIYCPTDRLPSAIAGLIAARYSRSPLTMAQIMSREYLKEFEVSDSDQDHQLDLEKADGLARRVLAEYGDDSVRELASTTIYFHGVSMIAAKLLEEPRIGVSPLEKSTRYVPFDGRNTTGQFNYWRDPAIMESQFCDKYLETTDAAFELYAKTLDPLNEYFSRQSPIETQVFPEPGIADSRVPWPELTEKGQRAAKRAYAQSIRAQSFDVARVLLPASALTNLGLSGNSRALSTLMIKLHANELSEAQMLGVEGTEQLRKTLLPNFWVDIDNHHGQAAMEAQNGQSQVLKRIALEAFKNKRPEDVNLVNLIDLSSFDETTLAAAGSLYSFTNLPLLQVAAEIRENPDLENIILNEALNFRTNRRHKPPRGFELTNGGVTFEYLADFGIFRDLQRHRIGTLLHQPYTTEHGYDVSPILEDVGMEGEVRDLFDRVGELHCDMRKELPNESQYMTLLGHNMRWIYATNLRQLFWLTELRSTPQAHPKYRRVAQEMYAQTVEKYPFMAELNSQQSYVMQDSNDNNLVRLDAASKSEARNEE